MCPERFFISLELEDTVYAFEEPLFWEMRPSSNQSCPKQSYPRNKPLHSTLEHLSYHVMLLQHIDVCQAIVKSIPWADEAWVGRERDLGRDGWASVAWKSTPETRPFSVVLVAELSNVQEVKTFNMKGMKLKDQLAALARRGVGPAPCAFVQGNVEFSFLLQHNDEREPRWVDVGRSIHPGPYP